MNAHGLSLAPLWGTETQWREANLTLGYLIRTHGPNLDRTVSHAQKIREALDTLFPILDGLCAETCRFCPEPCCVSAVVWIDFNDLLFMRLAETYIPRKQLIAHTDRTCRHFGPKGCSLPRMSRPWACTWYLCPPQMARLRKKRDLETYENATRIVKTNRKRMESEFVKTVMSGVQTWSGASRNGIFAQMS